MHYPELIKLQPEHRVLFLLFYKFSELVITQSLDHVKIRLTSQLINGISRVLQKLLKYFNDTIILVFFIFPLSGVFPMIFILYLNDSEFAMLSFGSSLQYCHKLPDDFE